MKRKSVVFNFFILCSCAYWMNKNYEFLNDKNRRTNETQLFHFDSRNKLRFRVHLLWPLKIDYCEWPFRHFIFKKQLNLDSYFLILIYGFFLFDLSSYRQKGIAFRFVHLIVNRNYFSKSIISFIETVWIT